MNAIPITEAEFRALAEKYPFHHIAEILNLKPWHVSEMAKVLGVKSAFLFPRGSEVEVERIKSLAADGWSTKKIAKTLGRSQEFVSRHLGLRGPERLETMGWPKPITDELKALDGRTYDDVSQDRILREWSGHPIDGNAYARKMKPAFHTMGCAANLCVEA